MGILFKWKNFGKITTFLVVDLVIFVALLLGIELIKGKFSIQRNPFSKENTPDVEKIGEEGNDIDVINEAQRVASQEDGSDLVVVNKINKEFGNFKAVDNLSFGIHENDCFGLLGNILPFIPFLVADESAT